MKKTITLSLLICLAYSALLGQSKWHFGPTISLGFSGEQQLEEFTESAYGIRPNNLPNNIQERKVMPAFSVGLALERSFGNRWKVNLGVQYNSSQRFNQTEYSFYNNLGSLSSYNKSQNRLIVQQIQAPLQLQFHLGNPGKARPYFSIGGLGSYALSAKQQTTNFNAFGGETYIDSWEEKYELGNEWSPLKEVNIAMIYGIGIAFEGFSLELNRTQKVFKENSDSYYNSYYFDLYIAPDPRDTHATMLSIKYWL